MQENEGNRRRKQEIYTGSEKDRRSDQTVETYRAFRDTEVFTCIDSDESMSCILNSYEVSRNTGEIYLNGNKYSDKILVEVIEGQDLINIDENLKLTALSEGSVKLRICMEDNNEIYQELTINIVESAGAVTTYQLIGDESLKWGRTKVIQSIKSVNGVSEPAAASFEVTDKDELLSSYDINSSSVTITANNENKTGTIIISCTFENGDKVEKEIRITSLWM